LILFLGLLAVVLLLFLVPTKDSEPVSSVRMPTVEARLTPPLTTGNLEDKLRQISSTHPGSYGVVVHDPSSGQTVSLAANKTFAAASLAKLPVLLTLYKGAARGEIDLNEKITLRPDDVAAYGSGVLQTHAPGETMTLRECAEYLIKESDNTAWLMLERELGREEIKAEITALGATGTDYDILVTTPSDVLLMLRAIADPTFTTPKLSDEMLDAMTYTAYEDRLPQPLPKGTRVAHKIGSYEDTFSDAGIIYPEGGKGDNYFIVVMSKNTTEDEARSAIRTMSLTTYRTLAGTPQTDR
jgi:beta-lactamase class A